MNNLDLEQQLCLITQQIIIGIKFFKMSLNIYHCPIYFYNIFFCSAICRFKNTGSHLLSHTCTVGNILY